MALGALLGRACVSLELSVTRHSRTTGACAAAKAVAAAAGSLGPVLDHLRVYEPSNSFMGCGVAGLARHAFPVLRSVSLAGASDGDLAALAMLQVGRHEGGVRCAGAGWAAEPQTRTLPCSPCCRWEAGRACL